MKKIKLFPFTLALYQNGAIVLLVRYGFKKTQFEAYLLKEGV